MSRLQVIFVIFTLVLLHATPAAAFGAGNIGEYGITLFCKYTNNSPASISKIEGHNWRHGDIEDMLKTVAFIKGHKWTSMMIRRVYFGNWLRDYSQAMDVGSLKGVQAGTIRILVWILSFLSFGYATAEFEVTEERLGVYRPEEHSKSALNWRIEIHIFIASIDHLSKWLTNLAVIKLTILKITLTMRTLENLIQGYDRQWSPWNFK